MELNLTPTIPLTVLIEGLALWLWCRAWCVDFRRILITLTLSPWRYWPTLLAMEAVIVLLEALILRVIDLPLRKAFVLSLLVNAVSFGFGLLLPF